MIDVIVGAFAREGLPGLLMLTAILICALCGAGSIIIELLRPLTAMGQARLVRASADETHAQAKLQQARTAQQAQDSFDETMRAAELDAAELAARKAEGPPAPSSVADVVKQHPEVYGPIG